MGNELTLNWNAAAQVLPIVLDFCQAKQKKADIDMADTFGKIADAVGISDPEAYLKDAIGNQLADALNAEGSEEIAAIVAALYKPLSECIFDFAKGGMKPEELIANFNKVYVKSLDGMEAALQAACGFDIPDGVLQVLQKYELSAVSIYCFAAAYMIYRKASEDAAIAREHRIEVERLCNESIAKLQEQHAAMETLVNDYLLAHLEPFARGVSAMDQAIIDNDDDGYIQANAGIWQMLGRNAQYTNAEEFNDLMLSDEAFKL